MTELARAEKKENEPFGREILYFGTLLFSQHEVYRFPAKSLWDEAFFQTNFHWPANRYIDLFGEDWDGKWYFEMSVEPDTMQFREGIERIGFKECMRTAKRYITKLVDREIPEAPSFSLSDSVFRSGRNSDEEVLNLLKLCLEILEGETDDICTLPSKKNSHGEAEVRVGLVVYNLSREEIKKKLIKEGKIVLTDCFIDHSRAKKVKAEFSKPPDWSNEQLGWFEQDVVCPEWQVNLMYRHGAEGERGEVYRAIRRVMGYDTPEHQEKLWDYALSRLDRPEYWRVLDMPERAKLARLQTNPLDGAFGY